MDSRNRRSSSLALSCAMTLALAPALIPVGARAQEIVDLPPDGGQDALPYQQALHLMTVLAPSFSLRGGSGEILRGIIARGLGLR